MNTTLNFEIIDTYNIQLGDYFNEVIKNYINVVEILNYDQKIKLENNKENWAYIEAKQKSYYGLIEALWNSNLIKKNMNVLDIGSGYGTTLFNLAFQFKHYKKCIEENIFNNTYTGIEIDKTIINRLKYINTIWEKNDLVYNIINKDVMDHNYSQYDLITCYTPLKNEENLYKMYEKIFKEIKEKTLFIEHYNHGLGVNKILYKNIKQFNLGSATLLFGGKKQNIYFKLKEKEIKKDRINIKKIKEWH